MVVIITLNILILMQKKVTIIKITLPQKNKTPTIKTKKKTQQKKKRKKKTVIVFHIKIIIQVKKTKKISI